MKRNINTFLILLLISGITIGIVEAKVKNTSSSNTSVPQILGWPPWDGTSPVQSTNTKNVFMKVDYLIDADWIDIEGYYNQINYFQLPISVKLVNGTNAPIKYRDIKVWIDEYKGDSSSGYTFIKLYSKTVKTSSTGNAEFLFSFPYKGYDRELFRIKTQYYDPTTGNYAYRLQNIHVAWYINSASSFGLVENIENMAKTEEVIKEAKWRENK